MPYAIVIDNNILDIFSEKDPTISDDIQVEITDEQVLEIESSDQSMLLVDGELLTLSAHLLEPIKKWLRQKRNRLLAESDWTQLSDSPLDEDTRSAWATYRQDLRDLTDNIDENGEVTFPTAP